MREMENLSIRIPKGLGKQARKVFEREGYSLKDGVRVFLMRAVAEQKIPIPMNVPNLATREAMREGDHLIEEHEARFREDSGE